MELSEELIAKAKGTKTPEELAALAKESSIDLTEEEAKAYFEQLHPKTGELSDDELDNVAGGGCHNGGRLVVSVMHYCDEWRCKDDGSQCDIYGMLVRCNGKRHGADRGERKGIFRTAQFQNGRACRRRAQQRSRRRLPPMGG